MKWMSEGWCLVLPTKASYRNTSCHNCLLELLEPVLFFSCTPPCCCWSLCFWVNHIRDLQVECSKLALISSSFSSVSTILSLFCFFFKERCSWAYFFHHFENCWRSWNSNTRILMVIPSLAQLIGFIFHISIMQGETAFQMNISPSKFSIVRENVKQISVYIDRNKGKWYMWEWIICGSSQSNTRWMVKEAPHNKASWCLFPCPLIT